MPRLTSEGHWSLILAGGDGTRLQELTRQIAGAPIPKQYCRILGERSLLEATLARSQFFTPRERTMVIVNADHLAVGGDQMAALPRENILVQPCNRDTGPGILFALLHLAHRQPRTAVAVFPSDHYVGDDHAFIAHVARAARLVGEYPDKIVVLGIRPDRPEAALGYITPAQPVWIPEGTAFRVGAFREKPSCEQARSLLAQGALWNSFVMVFRLARMLELLRWAAPDKFRQMGQLNGDVGRGVSDVYRLLTPWNFSTQVLARIPQHLLVLPVDDVQWSDWGTRESIEHTFRTLKQPPPWWHPTHATAA